MIYSKLQNFAATASKQVKGKLGTAVLNSINCDQGLLTSVLQKAKYLRDSVDIATSWINLFSTVANKIPDDANLTVNIDSQYLADVDESRDVIMDGLTFIKEHFSDGFTITDGQGRLYNMLITDYKWTRSGHNYQGLLMTKLSHDIRDAIFYLYDGKLMFNQVIHTSDFLGFHLIGDTNTISGDIQNMSALRGINFNGTLGGLPGTGTLLDKLQALGATGSTLADMADSIAPGTSMYKGKLKLIWDVIRDYVDSSEINAALLETVQGLSNGATGLQGVIDSIPLKIKNARAPLIKFWNGLVSAFTQGGFKGAVIYIYSFFQSAASMTEEDGRLSFTNNATLIPTQYIAGLVSTVASVAVSLIGIIAMAVNQAVGIAIASIGAALLGAFRSIEYDADATRVGIQTSGKVLVPAFPQAFLQDSFTPSAEILNFMNDFPVSLYSVPGGYILLGPGGFDEDGKVVSARVEFHPSCCGLLDFDYFDDILTDCHYSDRVESADAHLVRRTCYVNFNLDPDLAHDIEIDWSQANKPMNIQNESNNRVSTGNDLYFKQLMTFNSFVFLYWILSLYHAKVTAFSGEYYFIAPQSLAYFTFGSDGVSPKWDWNVYHLLMQTAPMFVTTDRASTLAPRGIALMSWSEITKRITAYASNNGPLSEVLPYMCIDEGRYFNDPVIAQATFDWAIVPAKYDASTFLGWIILTVIVVAVVATATVIATVKVKKVIQNKRAKLNSEVESAWDSYKKGEITYNDYRKTVKRANRWQSVIGGTRYDYENYWNGDQSDASDESVSTDPGSVSSISSICSDLNEMVFNPEQAVTTDGGFVSLEQIKTLITGL